MPGGAGFSRLPDGRSAFVDGALPGDQLIALSLRDKKSFVEVTRFELEVRSPERITPACPVADACGGCNWMALPYAKQLEHKASLVVEALERTGRLQVPARPVVVTAGSELGYRLRVRLHLEPDGRVGFFGRHSQALVEMPECLVLSPELALVLDALRALSVGQRRTLGTQFSSVDLRAVPGDGGVELELEPRRGAKPGGGNVDALVEALAEHARVGIGAARRSGLRRYDLPGGGFLRVPSLGFTQVNWAVNAALVSALLEGVKSRGATQFLDLYAGVGNFTVPLALAGLTGTAVELEPTAAAALREALREQALDGVEVLAGDAAVMLGRNRQKLRGVEVVLLDPPRSGAKDCVEPLLSLAPRAIGYVACDPVTLARDLRELVAGGYELDGLTCFDMFPQTHHVETLAWLRRTAS